MKISFYLTLVLAICISAIHPIQAQSKRVKNGKTAVKASKLNLSKAVLKQNKYSSISKAKSTNFNATKQGKQVATPNNTKPTATKGEFAKILEDENKQLLVIKSHQISFPANTLPTQNKPLSTIDLFDGNGNEAKRIGSLHFYSTNAKALSEKAKMNDNNSLQLAYHIDMFNGIMSFLKQNRSSVIIYDKKTQEAYLSAAKQGNSRGRW